MMYSGKYEETCRVIKVQWSLSLWNKQFGFLEHLLDKTIEYWNWYVIYAFASKCLKFMHGMCDAVQ